MRGEPQVPLEVASVDFFRREGLTRREAEYIVALAGLSLTAILAVNAKLEIDAATYEAWPDSKTELEHVLEVSSDLPRWVVFGGLGRQSNRELGDRLATMIRDDPAQRTSIASVNYPNQGFNFSEAGSLMDGLVDEKESLNLHLQSLGLIIGLLSALAMDKFVHFDRIDAFSCPSGFIDIYGEERRKAVAEVRRRGLRGNIAEKVAFTVFTETHLEDRRDFLGRFLDFSGLGWAPELIDSGKKALREAAKGSPPKLYVAGLYLLCDNTVASLVRQCAQKGMIDKNTIVTYYRTPDDTTVMSEQSSDNCGDAFREAEAQYTTVTFYGRHADTVAAMEAGREKFGRI